MANNRSKPISEVISDLIAQSDLHLVQIANRAEVDYQRLWRWTTGNSQSYSVEDAEKVYTALTGKHFHD